MPTFVGWPNRFHRSSHLLSVEMSVTIRVRVPAKINLSLAVGPPRDDGFHELATVFMGLSLYDDISVTDRAAGSGLRVTVTGSQAS